MTLARATAAVTVFVSLIAVGGSSAAQTVRPLGYTRFVLPNGLVALVNEDHSAPVVAVDVWYRVGAKDEHRGHTGLAHLCEHLMGEGSPNEPLPEKVFVQSIGGASAHWGVTGEDITHFFATVPSNQLETMLWLESDRMAAPLSRADSGHVSAARTVIRQERALSRESPVFGMADGLTVHWLFPDGSPYSIDPLGPMTDLDVATAADAKAFCLPYYVPNNAVVSLSGDVSPASAKTLITKYFHDIPKGASPVRPSIPDAGSNAATRLVLEDPRAKSARLRFAFILSTDRTGRLSKALVYDRELATRIAAGNFDFERGGLFQIEIFPRPNASLTRIEAVVDSVLAGLVAQPATRAELDAFARSNAVLATTTLQTRSARADTLAHGEVFARDPVAYAKQVQRAFALTPADLARVAQRYFTERRVVMSMVPAGKLDLISRPDLPFTNVTGSPPKAVP
jgi:zinc protease